MDIKSILGSVTDKASSLAKSAARKTSEAAEQAKLLLTIKSEKGKLEIMYATLGKLFYEQVKGNDIRAQVAAQVMEIDEQKKVIQDLTAEMSEVSGHIICDGCSKEIDIDDVYCPSCGKRQEARKIDITDDLAEKISEELADDFTTDFGDIADKYFD